jgi:hypothetical protein
MRRLHVLISSIRPDRIGGRVWRTRRSAVIARRLERYVAPTGA